MARPEGGPRGLIVIDSREAAEARRIREELEKMVEVEVRPLPAGDYYVVGVERSALIERKKVLDFLNSLKGRLWEQLETMKEFEGERILLLEGYLPLYRRRGWSEASVLAMMDAVVNKWGVPIIPVPDMKATLTYLTWKEKALGSAKKPREYPLRPRSREMSLEEQALYTLEGLVGHETAKALLRRFGSLGKAINFFQQDLGAVLREAAEIKVGGRRIPEKVVRRVHEVVNHQVEF